MLTDRGRSLLLLGGLVYLGAWAFGARVLYPLAVGLVLAVVAAALWVRMLRRPMRLRRSVWRGEHLAGDDVYVGLELDVEGRCRRWRSSPTSGLPGSASRRRCCAALRAGWRAATRFRPCRAGGTGSSRPRS